MNFIKEWLNSLVPLEVLEAPVKTVVSPKQLKAAVRLVREKSAYAHSFDEDELINMVWKMVHTAAQDDIQTVSAMGITIVKDWISFDEQQIDVLVDPAVGQTVSYKELPE